MVAWAPLLEGEDAVRARSFVSRAAAELAATRLTDPSVGYGLSGAALLHGFRAMEGEADADEALATIERVIEHLQERPTPWLFVGYAGVGLTAQLLAPVIGDQDELLADLDSLVYPVLDRDAWNHEWELQIGLIGLGVYAVTRGNDDRAQHVLRHLMSLAVEEADGTTWPTHGIDGPPNFNLGMAHGVAAAIALLSLLYRPDRLGVRDALAGGVRWLRAQESTDKVPSFGQQVGAPGWRVSPNYNGWCYGDPATALVLARAATCLDDPSLHTAAHELALRDARRTSAEMAGCTVDENICHGAAGRAHMLHELALIYDDDELATAARSWYVAALEAPPVAHENNFGLQTGLAGRALAVLAGYSAVPPSWGRIMLLR